LLKLAQLIELPDFTKTGLDKAETTKQLERYIQQGIDASDYFWNESIGAFSARNIVNGEYSDGFSSASALCFYADAGSQGQRRNAIGVDRYGRR